MNVAQNSGGSAKRVRGKPWPKGVSGNPAGRPKYGGEFRELCKDHGPNALRTLLDVMEKGTSDSARIAAAKEILERAYGSALPAESNDPFVRQILAENNSMRGSP